MNHHLYHLPRDWHQSLAESRRDARIMRAYRIARAAAWAVIIFTAGVMTAAVML